MRLARSQHRIGRCPHGHRCGVTGIQAEPKARKARSLTQPALTEISGVHKAEISRIERGLANPPAATLLRLADSLGQKLTLIPHECVHESAHDKRLVHPAKSVGRRRTREVVLCELWIFQRRVKATLG